MSKVIPSIPDGNLPVSTRLLQVRDKRSLEVFDRRIVKFFKRFHKNTACEGQLSLWE